MQRFEPYSSAFILGNKTKDADRAKNCLQGLYETVCTDRSNTEMIPEYYFCPELYQNRNRYHTGLRQEETIGDVTGKLFVDHMKMPPYAANAFDLTRILREELETKHVRENIHKWIDLIFGVD